MILTINALKSVTLSDPNPIEGVWSTSMDAGTTKAKSITSGQLERLAPSLTAMETGLAITWSVAADPALDPRAENSGDEEPVVINGLSAAIIAAAGGPLVIYGSGLLTGFTSATLKTGATNYITYQSQLGAGGNVVSIKHLAGHDATTLGVSVLGNAITVQLAAAGSTLAQVAAAVNAYPAAAALVIATVTGSAAAAAMAASYLTGGRGSTVAVRVGGLACAVTKLTATEIDVTVPGLSPLSDGNTAVVLVVSGPHTYFAGAVTLTS